MNPRLGSLGNILRNTGWMLGGKGFGGVLSLAYLAIVTRSLGIEGFGQFTLVLGVAQAVELLITFQSWQIVVRYGMPHLQGGRAADLARLLRFTTWLDIGAALVAVGVVAVVMRVLGFHYGWDADFIRDATACGIVFVFVTHWTPIGALRLHDRFATAAMAESVTPVVRFLGAILVWLTGPSVIGFLAVWVAAELLTAVAYWVSALRLPELSWRLDRPLRWREVAEANPGIVNYAVTTNLASSLDVGGKQVVVLLIGLLLSPAAVGGFRLAQQLAQALAKFSQMMARAIFPELMRTRAGSKQTADFEALLARTLRLTAIGGALVFVVLLILGRPVLGLIGGPQFLSAYPILLLLGTSAAIEFAAVGFEPALVALGRPGLALKLRIVSTAVLLIAIVVLTQWLGTLGAGFAVLISSILSIAMLWGALRHVLRHFQPENEAGAMPPVRAGTDQGARD